MPDPPAPPKPPARFDLHVVFETLRGAKATDAWVHEWVSQSYDAPAAFNEALYAYATGRRRGMKSRLGRGYELYNDCVLAHLGAGKTAFIACEGGVLEEVSYDTLNDRCTALSGTWKRAGVEPGASVCVVLPIGVEHAVALLTALRMGLTVSTLPPLGPTYVANRLDALACDWVVTNERLRNALRLPAERVLPVIPTQRSGAPGVHVYAPDDVALRLLSPFGEPEAPPDEPPPPPEPVETSASALHLSLVRDGMIVLGLDPADVVAMPGLDPAQFQPLMLLAVLAAGGCWAELGVADLARDPRARRARAGHRPRREPGGARAAPRARIRPAQAERARLVPQPHGGARGRSLGRAGPPLHRLQARRLQPHGERRHRGRGDLEPALRGDPADGRHHAPRLARPGADVADLRGRGGRAPAR